MNQCSNSILVTSILTTVLLMGCSQSPKTENDTNETSYEAQTSANDATVDVNAPITTDVDVADEPMTASQHVKSDIPLSEYKDINRHADLMWLTPFFLAQTSRNVSEEELLNLMSPEYYNELDGFKKQDIAKEQLPKIHAELDKYRGDYRVQVPAFYSYDKYYSDFKSKQRAKNHSDVTFTMPTLNRYDFSTNQFPMDDCSFRIQAQNQQRIEIDVQKMPLVEDCTIEVTDENLARKIEEAINAQTINGYGEAYYRLTADLNNVTAYPVYAKLTYFNETTGEEFITKEFHFEE